MVSVVLVVGCTIGILIIIALAIGLALLMNSSSRDQVSSAREGWIQRRSEKDEEGW
jgi:hypothetical protein